MATVKFLKISVPNMVTEFIPETCMFYAQVTETFTIAVVVVLLLLLLYLEQLACWY